MIDGLNEEQREAQGAVFRTKISELLGAELNKPSSIPTIRTAL